MASWYPTSWIHLASAWYTLYMVMDVRYKLCTTAHLDLILPSGFGGGLGYLSWLKHQKQSLNNLGVEQWIKHLVKSLLAGAITEVQNQLELVGLLCHGIVVNLDSSS